MSRTLTPEAAWSEPKAFKVHVRITKDEDGTYSAIALNLPGAGSCGDTEEEAMQNFLEAVRGVLESYGASGQEIPWKEAVGQDIPSGAIQKWILVHA